MESLGFTALCLWAFVLFQHGQSSKYSSSTLHQQTPWLYLHVEGLDPSYDLYEYNPSKLDNSGTLTPSYSTVISRVMTKYVGSQTIIFWKLKEGKSVPSPSLTSSVKIQLRLTCEARYFTKWAFNSDSNVADDLGLEYLDMNYAIGFYIRAKESPFSNVWSWNELFENATQVSELNVKSFHPEFKSASINCVNYGKRSVKSEVYIFQRFDPKQSTPKQPINRLIQLKPDFVIPCKVRDPDVTPTLFREIPQNFSWINVNNQFDFTWNTGFKARKNTSQFFHLNKFDCNSAADSFRYTINDDLKTPVVISLRMSREQQELKFRCSVPGKQEKSRSIYIRSIRVENCDSPDYCHYNREDNTTRQNQVCASGNQKTCTMLKPIFKTGEQSKLGLQGKVVCLVDVDGAPETAEDYYFRGISYANNYLLSRPPSESLDDIIRLRFVRFPQGRTIHHFSCTALRFLTFTTMKISVLWRNQSQEVVTLPTEEMNGWTHGISNVVIPLTHNVTSVNCHVPWFNSTKWLTTSYTLADEDRDQTTTTTATTSTSTRPTPSKSTTRSVNHVPPTTTFSASVWPFTIKDDSTPRSEETFRHHNKPEITKPSTASTQKKKPTTKPPIIDSDVAVDEIHLISATTTITTVIPTILAFLVFFLFIGWCIHRTCIIECLCCRKESLIGIENHQLMPIKSKREKLSIPPAYLMSAKDFSVDYNQIVSQGQFSTLYQGDLKKNRKCSVLMKVNKIPGDSIEISSLIRDIQMRIIAGESNECITGIIGAYFSRPDGKVYIDMQSNTSRSMREFLTNKNMPMGQMKMLNMPPHEMVQTFCTWLKGVSKGLEFLHSKQIVHGNLAAENILVCLKNTSSVSITGFSHSQQMGENSFYFVKSRSWTTGWETSGWRWMPMECLRYMEFSKESDVWSFGVLMWEIFSLGAIPYSKNGYRNLSMEFIQKLEFGVRLSQPQLASREIYRKMETCWSRYGKDRPKGRELCGYFDQDQPNLNNYVNLPK